MYSLIGALSDTFSRQDAISHGQLVDVSEPARRLGYGCQVAVTAALWNEYIATSPGLFVEAQQKRLREILSLLRFAILTVDRTSRFTLTHGKPVAVMVTALADPDDCTEAAITIMLPGEG